MAEQGQGKRKFLTLPVRVLKPKAERCNSEDSQNVRKELLRESKSFPFPRPRARTSLGRFKLEEEEKSPVNDPPKLRWRPSSDAKQSHSHSPYIYPDQKVRLAVTRMPSHLTSRKFTRNENVRTSSSSDVFRMSGDDLVHALDPLISDLVNDLDMELMFYAIGNLLNPSQVEHIKNQQTKELQVDELILMMKNHLHSRALIKTFLGFLAGIQPKLFQKIKGRSPTYEEELWCLNCYVKDKRTAIIDKGHILDCDSDERINLETSYIQLYLIKTDESFKDNFDKNKIPGIETEGENLSSLQQTVHSPNNGEKVAARDLIDRRFIQGRKVVLKGRAGIGKTTLLQWLCYEWAKRRVPEPFSLMFLLQLRVLLTIDYPVSLLQLLMVYCTFPTGKMVSEKFLTKWIENWCHQILILLDGIDEIKDLRYKLKYTKRIQDINAEALPVDIFINILRGDLLPQSKTIITTRPTLGLHALESDISVEVMGLQRAGIEEYIERNIPKRNSVEVAGLLIRNAALMSLCSITYYCTILCSLLMKDPSLAEKDINTYTRLTSCIVMKMICRSKNPDTTYWDGRPHFKPYIPKLAKLACWAVFCREPADACRTLFDMKDMVYADLTKEDLQQANDDGIIHFSEAYNDKECRTKKFLFQFTHLTIQELFASAYFLDGESVTKSERKRVLNWVVRDGYFNMAILFIFGLRFDTTCEFIKMLRSSIRHKLVSPTSIHKKFIAMFDTSMDARLLEYLKNMCNSASITDKQDFKLQVAQLLYESNTPEMSAWLENSNVLVNKDGALHIKDVALTAVDIMALVFVAQHSRNLKYLHLVNVNMDDASFRNIAEFLTNTQSLLVLNLSFNHLSAKVCQALELVLPFGRCLTTLQLNGVGFGDDGVLSVVNGLLMPSAMKSLSLDSNGVTDIGIKYLVKETVPKLSSLSLKDNSITDVGVMNICVSDMLTSLRGLFLGYNQISITGANYLITKFVGDELSLRGNQIDMTKMKASAHDKVQLIDLQENVVGAKRVTVVIKELKRKKPFPVLDLEKMGISDYSLCLLVKALVGNKEVERVCLARNRLSQKSEKPLKALIFTCPKLEHLDVSGNSRVLDMCEAFVPIQLKRDVHHLDLSRLMNKEGVIQLSHLIRKNDALETLQISHNTLNADVLQYLVKGLKHCRTLTSLDLSSTYIGYEHQECLSNIIRQCSSLRSLDLSKNKLGFENMVHIGNALRGNPKLEFLNLNHNSIGDEGLEELLDAIQYNDHLKTVHISSNNIGPKGMVAVAEALQNRLKLSEFDLSHNGTDEPSLERFSVSFGSAIHLTNIKLQDMCISADGARHIAAGLCNNTSLISLDLFQNNIRDDGAEAIAEALKNNAYLRTLILRANQLGTDGITAIAQSLLKNRELCYLDLGMNKIGSPGAREIGKALQHNNTLQELDLFFSDIDQTSVMPIAAALRANTSLRSLALGWNDIRSRGVFVIAKYIVNNNHLRSLDLSENNIGSGGALFLAEQLKKNTSLTHLNLEGNHLHALGVDAMVTTVEARALPLNVSLQHNGVFVKSGDEILARKEASAVARSDDEPRGNEESSDDKSGRHSAGPYYNHRERVSSWSYYKNCSYENVEYYLQNPVMYKVHNYINMPQYENAGPGTLRPAVDDSSQNYLYYTSSSSSSGAD